MTTTTRPAAPPGDRAVAAWTAAALLAVVAWDASGLDLAAARGFGDAHGFALRDHWFFVQVLHEGARRLAWALAVALCIGVWWPWGVLRRIDARRRMQLAATPLLALAVVALAKASSATSCPWDLAEFGGLARHVSHWSWGQVDGGGGRCFPAGHASAAFAFAGGWFALRQAAPQAARRWLAAALAGGLVLGLAQQARGAHFMSHTLWTGWLCWATAWACDAALRRTGPHRAAVEAADHARL
ncbi:phosphatase PAP2 family protein [Xylophilus sp.]|uniref:phosphatase PAP2 family protein n=1 Tax=Xylophilus sp. TaxID=2653893 RepID=UPI0013BB2762|nr:phosphatase PAP2 family protein [Xylophilus sp.]KAF1048229.1 MAG: hypothetical protein GAK38_01478 [Xylophilus sp.]